MCVRGYVYVNSNALGNKKRVSGLQVVEIQAIVNHSVWVLGTELGSAKAVVTLSHLSCPLIEMLKELSCITQ